MTARAWSTALTLAALLLLVIGPPLLANGGTVRISREAVGTYLVSVFTSPTPLRTGEVDISVLVQDADRESVVDVPVWVEAVPVGINTTPVRHPATRQQATNKLFKAAKFDVTEPGEWEFVIRVGGDEGGATTFGVTLTEPTLLDRPYLLAALVLLPLALLAWLFLGREEPRPDQSRIAATI